MDHRFNKCIFFTFNFLFYINLNNLLKIKSVLNTLYVKNDDIKKNIILIVENKIKTFIKAYQKRIINIINIQYIIIYNIQYKIINKHTYSNYQKQI